LIQLNLSVKFCNPPEPGEPCAHPRLLSEDGIMPKKVKIVSHNDVTGFTNVKAYFFDREHAWDWWRDVDSSYGLDYSIKGIAPGVDLTETFSAALHIS
jgi:hypothetical protein